MFGPTMLRHAHPEFGNPGLAATPRHKRRKGDADDFCSRHHSDG
jgi:hypothetical protein